MIETHHVRSGFGKFSAVFFARAAWKLFPLPAHFPAHWRFKFAAGGGADQVDLPRLFFLCIKSSLVHIQCAGALTASSIVTNSSPRSRQRGSQCSSAASVRVRSAFCSRCPPSCRHRISPVPDACANARLARDAIGCMRRISHSAEGACQSPGSKVHITTRMLSSRASAASQGFLRPNGGRNHFGGAPSVFLIAECVSRSSTRMSAERFQNRFGCDSV